MGALHRLVYLLSKLDPKNVTWKHRQLEAQLRGTVKKPSRWKITENREAALANVDARIEDIHSSFDTTHHELDYARKILSDLRTRSSVLTFNPLPAKSLSCDSSFPSW